ncbi:MAG TPA: AI-2E family transporter [Acidimicrobiales bacterium]|nr:AI-2E family transporter [Acidimicrobiales bacterium]
MSAPAPRFPLWLTTAAGYAWRFLLLAGAAYVLGLAFGKLELIIVPVAAALLLATVLVPPAAWLRRKGMHPLPATWLVFLALLLIVGGIVTGIVPGIAGQFSALGKELSKALTQVEHWFEHRPFHLSAHQVQTYVNDIKSEVNANKSKLIHGALSGLTLLLQGLAAAVLTLVLTFFFVKDGGKITDWLLDLVPEERRPDLRDVGRAAWGALGGYVRGTAANGTINALLLSAGLLGLGVPLVAPLALLTFVGGFIPLVGAIITGLLAALVALVAKGFVAAIVVVGLIVVIHNVEGYLVGPLVLGRAVKLHPVAILLALAVGTIVGGAIGAFLAVPVTAVALAVNEHYRQVRRREREASARSVPREVPLRQAQ